MPETIRPVLARRYFCSSRTYRFLWLCLVIAFYYSSFRYPLQINDSSTSPTYVDTPFLLKIGKYIILICFCLWFILGECRFRILKRDIPIFVATSFFVCFSPLVAVIAALHVAQPLFLWDWISGDMLLLVPLLSMGYGIRVLPTGYGTRDDIDTIVRLIWVFLSLSMICLLLQVVLFITIGRLPALAYHESLSVRFGSIWDDPNSFPMMLAVFVPLVLFRFPSIAALILTVIGAVGVIVAAQSVTCVISVAISFMAALVLRLSDRTSAVGLATKGCVILVVSLVTTAVVDIGALTSVGVAWQQEKMPSITAHLSDFERLVDAHPLSLLGIAPTGGIGESGWINLLTNQGILLTALYGVFLISGIRQAATVAINSSIQEKGVFYGAFCFQVAFAVSLFMLPNNLVFPLNMINYILWSIVYMRRMG